MNQVDCWRGGAQTNRGNKYVVEKNNTTTIKIVSVICNFAKITNRSKNLIKLFQNGITKKNLCYLNGLKYIIDDFFV